MADINLLEQRSAIITDTTVDEAINVVNSAHLLLKHRVSRLGIRVGLAGGSIIAFDQLDIQGLFDPNGTWHTLAAAFGVAENGFTVFTPDVLETLAHGANGVVVVDASSLWAARVRTAQAGVTASPVTRTLDVGASIIF